MKKIYFYLFLFLLSISLKSNEVTFIGIKVIPSLANRVKHISSNILCYEIESYFSDGNFYNYNYIFNSCENSEYRVKIELVFFAPEMESGLLISIFDQSNEVIYLDTIKIQWRKVVLYGEKSLIKNKLHKYRYNAEHISLIVFNIIQENCVKREGI